MKIFIKFILALHVLPLFVLGWLTLFDLTEFSNLQWGISWFMTSVSAILLSHEMFFIVEKGNVEK